MDDQLPMQWNQLLTMGLNVLGTVALVFYCACSLRTASRLA